MTNEYMTLFELLSEYKVEIPIVQRDYAQGREGVHETSVRKSLLQDIKNAISETERPLDLSFVYGKLTEDERFIPLDGQQRLTTLFLLHVYAFRNAGRWTERLNKFTYKTRGSSNKFLSALIEHRAEIFEAQSGAKKIIQDAEWFNWDWGNDPTVKSCLTMLQDISQIFADIKDLPQRLLKTDPKLVTFSFIEIEKLGMDDSLYIKLNARGRALTPLENFKAKLISKIENMKQDLPADVAEQFRIKFDSVWSRWFWKLDRKQFDNQFLAFFGGVLRNSGAIKADSGWSTDRDKTDKRNYTYWANSLDIDKIDICTEQIVAIYETLTAVSENIRTNDSEQEKFVSNELDTIIREVVKERRSLADRLRLFTLTEYLRVTKGKDRSSIFQWLRICRNLILNSDIDNERIYEAGLKSIHQLLDHYADILEFFADGGKTTSFSVQVEEEQIKARIVLNDTMFAQSIYEAEKHPYFSGKIIGGLKLAKENSAYSHSKFVEYWTKIEAIFDNDRPKYGSILRRALLSIGDYTVRCQSSNYLTLCVDDPKETRDVMSMKTLFSNADIEVKTLLDLIDTQQDIKTQLIEIIEVNKPNISKNDWRYCFMTCPELLEGNNTVFSSGQYRMRRINQTGNTYELILVPNLISNGFNYEIFALTLSNLLKLNVYTSFAGEYGTWGDRYLVYHNFHIRFKNGGFAFMDNNEQIVYKTMSDDPLSEALSYLKI